METTTSARTTALDRARAYHAQAVADLHKARRDHAPDSEIVRHAESRFIATLEKVTAAVAAEQHGNTEACS